MDNKLFFFTKDDSSEPYAIIIQTNDNLLLKKFGALEGVDFRQKLKLNLIKFIHEQCEEFNSHEKSLYISQETYLWISIEDINLFKYLRKKLEIINRVEIADIIYVKNNNLDHDIYNKFNYYLLENELVNDKEKTKRIKI